MRKKCSLQRHAYKYRVLPPKGEIFQVKALISHQMETGLRHDNEGNVIPRKIIHRFVCRYNGDDVFVADLHEAIAANPLSRVLPARHRERPA